jgi:hypothetical protein
VSVGLPVTGTTHILPFDKLSPLDYEPLRARQRETERRADHLFETSLERAFRGEV